MGIIRILLAVALAGLGGAAQADDALASLERKTSEAIHSACHGYAIDMLPDLLSFARDWLNEKSQLCKDLRAQGYDYDVGATLKRHKIAFTAEDSARIDALYDAWRFKDMNLQIECDSEYMCMRVRQEMQDRQAPVSQAQYQRLADYCERQLAPYSCIQNWFRDEWLAKGNRNPPAPRAAAESKLSFDRLMQDSEPARRKQPADGAGLSLDALMGGGGARQDNSLASIERDTGAKPIGFDDIHAAREDFRLSRSQQALAAKNQRIARDCQCALDGVSCFAAGSYAHAELDQAMRVADGNYESQKRKVCGEWARELRGRSADRAEILSGLEHNLDIVLENLDKLQGNYGKIVAGLDDKQARIEVALERQRQQRQAAEDNAALGKALAIGLAGVVAANADLPADKAVEVFSAVTRDIIDETGGSNVMALSQDFQTRELDLQSVFSGTGGASLGGTTGGLTLTCKMQGLCAEYSFSSSQDRDSFARRCAQVVQGACPAGPSCFQSEGGRTVKTFSYNRSAAEVKRACEQGRGTFSG